MNCILFSFHVIIIINCISYEFLLALWQYYLEILIYKYLYTCANFYIFYWHYELGCLHSVIRKWCVRILVPYIWIKVLLLKNNWIFISSFLGKLMIHFLTLISLCGSFITFIAYYTFFGTQIRIPVKFWRIFWSNSECCGSPNYIPCISYACLSNIVCLHIY